MAGPVTALQVKATELCHTYFTALGHLQNAAPEAPLEEEGPTRAARMAGYQGLVDELAAAVVQKHRDIDRLIDELERMPRSEEDEVSRLRVAQEEHAAGTERLRASVAKTGASHGVRLVEFAASCPHHHCHRVCRESGRQRARFSGLAPRLSAGPMDPRRWLAAGSGALTVLRPRPWPRSLSARRVAHKQAGPWVGGVRCVTSVARTVVVCEATSAS